jgi:cytochrome c oxidase cbb3-type subunit I/II
MESSSRTSQTCRVVYDDGISRLFVAASVVWGLVAMAAGAWIALQLAFWQANLPPYLSFGRLRPVHTNAIIFAFVGNMIFAGIYYSTQRLLKTAVASRLLARCHFWGWQAIIVAAALTLPLGFTQAKEYAELEWPIDIAIAAVWVLFAWNFFAMIRRRRERQLYVAIWFYIATIVAVTALHVVNSLAVPVSLFRSYSLFGGVQDALVQWWYGHNAVAFFLTTPVLGIMYYFVPKAAGRPVYSYRLSIIHFWALVFMYIWAGPHHLLNTALPDWAQSVGMLFSVMLVAPSWGGMINGFLTLRSAWHKLRQDPVLKFFAAGLTFYGMATFEGPLLSIKAVSGLAHYTDWIVGHVHAGGLGWNGFMAAGMFYWMVPRLFGTELHSRNAANLHFYLGTFGILMYVVSMWVSGITQGLMWRAENVDGGLVYPSFIETLLSLRLMYWTRLLGGLMYLSGFVLLTWNLVATARSGRAVDESIEVFTPEEPAPAPMPWHRLLSRPPLVVTAVVLVLLLAIGFVNAISVVALMLLAFVIGVGGLVVTALGRRDDEPGWHQLLEGRGLLFTVLTVVAVLIGGIAEIVPVVVAGPAALRSDTAQPYTALELEGHDVYLREGCYTCHSQMIRPFTWETARYGEVSSPEESLFDHPFQWGSRRIGPDLARVGGKYSHLWHYQHLLDPRAVSPGSNMPPYGHLGAERVDFAGTDDKLRAMRTAGVPYTAQEIAAAAGSAADQARAIARELAAEGGIDIAPDSKLLALIAYLQRLGRPPAPADRHAGQQPVARAPAAPHTGTSRGGL